VLAVEIENFDFVFTAAGRGFNVIDLEMLAGNIYKS
jgi:hypothetical protein